MIFNRESTIGLLTALLLTFTAWTWGGVILWTQWTTAALGLLTLALALFPSTASPLSTTTSSTSSRPATLPLLLSALLGLLTFLGVASFDLWSTLSLRDATLLLIPSATLPPLTFSDWGLRASLIGLFSAILVPIIFGLIKPSERRRRLLRFWPFWLGLFLFAWITCQSLNPWGKVVQRDLFWHIIPQSHITWLPSGLDAPFASTEEPGGMNGWRQLLIFIGPWALLCALRAAVIHRRSYGWLATIAIINGLGVALAGNLARANKWKDFLGISDPGLNSPPFGPFIYKNHAGTYLYLAAALAFTLMFFLAKRRGDKVDRGGPHLLAGIAAVFLALGAASTMSLAATLIAGALVLLVVPAAFFFDEKLRSNLSPIPAIAMAVLAGVVVYVGLLTVDAKKWRDKIQTKQEQMVRLGVDDRAPLRAASWMMIETASTERQFSGWGAGSYRWVSPEFLKTQPGFVNKRGELDRRATHAHNDWIQAPIEWGLAGWVMVIGAILFFAINGIKVFRQLTATSLVLYVSLMLFALHAFLDFLLFIPQLTSVCIIIAWLSLLMDEVVSPKKTWVK